MAERRTAEIPGYGYGAPDTARSPPGEETWRVGGNALNADCERGFRKRPES